MKRLKKMGGFRGLAAMFGKGGPGGGDLGGALSGMGMSGPGLPGLGGSGPANLQDLLKKK